MPKRIDKNHREIRDFFRKNGFDVLDTHALPNFCDLVIGKNGVTVLIEVKDGGKSLTESQRKLQSFQGWYEIVRDLDDAQMVIDEVERE